MPHSPTAGKGVTRKVVRQLCPGGGSFEGLQDPKWQISKSPHNLVYDCGGLPGGCNQTMPPARGWAFCRFGDQYFKVLTYIPTPVVGLYIVIDSCTPTVTLAVNSPQSHIS